VIEDSKPAVPDSTQSAHSALFVVIDDENSVRTGMQERLQLWGYNVIIAADQEEAIVLLQQSARKPDGVIADYRLRNKHTGIEAIKAIHSKFGSDIPALIITGDTAAEQLREVNDSGFQILHKPVAPAKLRTFLRNTLKVSSPTLTKTKRKGIL
jgi:DNA-binding NtrC family response regulator